MSSHPCAFQTQLERRLGGRRAWSRARRPPQVLVRGPGREASYGDQETPFHVASIGKTMTAVLVMQCVESGDFALDAPVSTLLPREDAHGLVAPDVTVEDLLTHTAGLVDSFEGPVLSGSPLKELLVRQPDRLWTPADLIAFARENQPRGRAGRFEYSDTGYVLLGRILEEATGEPFERLVHRRIFDVLGMNRSFLPFRTAPARGDTVLAPAFVGGVEVSRFPSLSIDWAGGGVAATTGDLVRFGEGMRSGELIGAESRAAMSRVRNRLRPGIHYGAGLMELRFDGFLFLLRGLPRPIGHSGSLATHLYYDPVHDVHIALSVGSADEMPRSVRMLIHIEQLLAARAKTVKVSPRSSQ